MSSDSTTERRLPGALPLWEIPGWRDRYGVVAGITGRGDDAAAPFDLGLWTRQPVGDVMARWRSFRHALAPFPAMVLAHQVHGARVTWHDTPCSGWSIMDGADGHATGQPGLLLLVTVADCVPVYLVAPKQRAVALLHAGWRGTAAGMLAEGVRTLGSKAGASPDQLICHLGVAISGPEYEVGREVMAGVGIETSGNGPWNLDLRSVLASQADALGIGTVTASTHCSARDSGHFFSHRRSGGTDGRMVAYLGMSRDSGPDGPDGRSEERLSRVSTG